MGDNQHVIQITENAVFHTLQKVVHHLLVQLSTHTRTHRQSEILIQLAVGAEGGLLDVALLDGHLKEGLLEVDLAEVPGPLLADPLQQVVAAGQGIRQHTLRARPTLDQFVQAPKISDDAHRAVLLGHGHQRRRPRTGRLPDDAQLHHRVQRFVHPQLLLVRHAT